MSIKKNFFAPLSSGLGATRRAAMLLLVMMLTTVTTWADNYVTLTSSTSTQTWKNNTYVANGDVTIEGRITVTGTVTLKLTDGCTLRAPNGIEVKVGNSLTIEGGTNGTGTLIIAKNEYSKAGIGGGSGTHSWDPIKYGNITINGGTVNVQGGAYGAGIGGNNNSSIDGCGTITINGGIVNATGGTGAAGIGGGRGYDGTKGGCGDIVINGGQVTATGGDNAPGIGPGKGDAKSGSLVLGWTNTTDFIKVTGGNSAYGFSNRLESISFAKDKKFNISGGGEATTIEDIKNLESLTLIPKGSEQHQLSVATISGISDSYDLTDSYLDIPFSVSDAEKNTLTLGTDYTATLGTIALNSTTIHITEGGKYTLTITGKGSYAGSKSVDFEVISIGFKKDANGDDYINMPKTGIYYDAKIPKGVSSFNVYDDGGAKAQYSNNYDGGLVLTAPDHYVLQLTGTVTAEVWGKNLCDYLMVYDGVYDGGSTSAQKIGDKYGSDESGENIGTLISSGKQMTLTFHSDPSGQRDGLDLKVTLKRDIRSCDIANIDDQTYTGSAIEPDLVITYEGSALVKDVDYEVTYSANTTVGTATITITGKKNYAKTTSKTFNIVKATPTVTAPIAVADLEYKGSEQELVTKGDTDFGTLLYSLDGTNYSTDIPTATDAGTYTVYYKVIGDDNHNDVSGSIEVTIMGKNIAACDITVPNQTLEGPNNPFDNISYKFEYVNTSDGRSYATKMGIIVKDGDNTLTLGTDYTFGSVTMANGNPIQESAIGDECKVEIVGQGNYAGSKWETFKIVAPDANGTWGDNNELTWAFHDGTLTISPTENVQAPVAMKEANAGDYLWFSSANYIETITIGEGVSTVANNAFNRVNESNVYGNVKTVSLPSTLTTIGDNAFAFCTGATITIPESVTTLGANPFNQVRCVEISKPLVDGNDNSDIISKMSYAQSATFTYKRSFTANVASTVCLPFDYTPQEGEGTYYTFTAIDKTTSPWTVTMTSNTAASLTANKPYMFKPAATGEVSFNGTASSFDPTSTYSSDVVNDPVVTGGKWNLIGTYESRQWDDTHNTGEIGSVYGFAAQSHNGGSYTVNPGDFVKAMAGASIAPFRAYLKYTAPGSSSAPRRGAAEEALPSRMSVRLVNADGDVTAIGTIDTKTGEIRFDSDAWYTLDGRRLNGKPSLKGMYINNGKKIIVK